MNYRPVKKRDGYPVATYHSEDRYVGTRALWLKVIIRAVFDWVSYRDNPDIQKLKLADSAKTWLFESSLLINGFETICQQIDLSPEKVRRWAKSISKEQVAKIEHLERDSGGFNDAETKYLAEKCVSGEGDDEEL